MNPSNYGDSIFPPWQLSGRRSGNLLSDSGRKERRGMPGRHSNVWNVRANDSCSSTFKFQPFPSTKDEENEISTPIHHCNDNQQSGFFGYRGLVYNEAPVDTAYPSYKDVLLSPRQVTDRKLTSSTSSRKDSSRNPAPGRSKRKRPRRKRRKKRSKTQLPKEIKAINRAVIAASRKLVSVFEMDHYSQESMTEEWNWLGDLRQRAYESDDFQN
ncbi:hypothetical protein THAOC_37002 [Thalassiosira oceanica]|uniref:Uncharacterized protein n=1 Tax=Thalassiosira oceanica TaxID=159749 RepID=K0R0W2_THAOC|nr:hypothetical protein THAOC_37002 [Thalassiosira oceanica]|eukprot:EJK44454.1 hypothetical protein THAOC_37002 [Thalassiosira oceanica]